MAAALFLRFSGLVRRCHLGNHSALQSDRANCVALGTTRRFDAQLFHVGGNAGQGRGTRGLHPIRRISRVCAPGGAEKPVRFTVRARIRSSIAFLKWAGRGSSRFRSCVWLITDFPESAIRHTHSKVRSISQACTNTSSADSRCSRGVPGSKSYFTREFTTM